MTDWLVTSMLNNGNSDNSRTFKAITTGDESQSRTVLFVLHTHGDGTTSISELRLLGDKITNEDLRQVKLGDLTRQAVAYWQNSEGEAFSAEYTLDKPIPAHVIAQWPKDRKQETAQWIAKVYLAAQKAGVSATRALSEKFEVSTATAGTLAKYAREMGTLSPTTAGKRSKATTGVTYNFGNGEKGRIEIETDNDTISEIDDLFAGKKTAKKQSAKRWSGNKRKKTTRYGKTEAKAGRNGGDMD